MTTSIVVDVMSYMNTLGEFTKNEEKNEAYIYTQPGVFYRDFEKYVAEKGYMYPAYPASKSICAMGGIVANNGAGEKTLHYGKAEDYVEEVEMVCSDGEVYSFSSISLQELEEKKLLGGFEGDLYKKIDALINENYDDIMDAQPNVSKNSAGYYLWNIYDKKKKTFNLAKIIVGSQGTFGIITNIKMRLVPIRKESVMLVLFMKNLDGLGEIVNIAKKYNPESIETYDKATLMLALRFWRGFIKKRGFLGFLKMGILFLPELFKMIRGGMPELVLLVEFVGDNKKDIARKMDLCFYAFKEYQKKEKTGLFGMNKVTSKMGAEKYWSIRRDSFKLLREHSQGKRTAPFIDDIVVLPEHLPTFLPELRKILAEYPIEYTLAGHAGSGNFHIIPLMDLKNTYTKDMILELSDKVYDLVLTYNGSITAEHNDGIIRTPYLKKMYGENIYGLFEQVKSIFDPKNIFNPGKKVGGTKEDIKKWLIKN
ncbi:MAG: FAD/FMN-containing dehydrogenase [Flavobacteriaceae bacterium]